MSSSSDSTEAEQGAQQLQEPQVWVSEARPELKGLGREAEAREA